MSEEYGYRPVNGQNGRVHYGYTGTPSSQSSREASREASRDPSPSGFLRAQKALQSPSGVPVEVSGMRRSVPNTVQGPGNVQSTLPAQGNVMQGVPSVFSTVQSPGLVQNTLTSQGNVQPAVPSQGNIQTAVPSQGNIQSTVQSPLIPRSTIPGVQSTGNVQSTVQSPLNPIPSPAHLTQSGRTLAQGPENPQRPPQAIQNIQSPIHKPQYNVPSTMQSGPGGYNTPMYSSQNVQGMQPMYSGGATETGYNTGYNAVQSAGNTVQAPMQNPQSTQSSTQNPYQAQRSLASQKYVRSPYSAAAMAPMSSNVGSIPLSATSMPNVANVPNMPNMGNMSNMPNTANVRPPTYPQMSAPMNQVNPGSQINQMNHVNAQMSQMNQMNQMHQMNQMNQMSQLNAQMAGMGVTHAGFNKLWGSEAVDLLQNRNILPPERIDPPKISLKHEFLDSVNCSPDIFRCTLTKIPETNSLLQKSRLPLGVLIHPFRDIDNLPVIHSSIIVRCRACRTYINPFVYFVDSKRWKCNLCYRVNELPEEVLVAPVTKAYGDPTKRPEVCSSTIEYIAPTEYMLRPPQPAVYVFVLDISRLALESNYLPLFCQTLSEELHRLPGDGRTQLGFIAFDSAIHFFCMPDNVSQPQEIVLLDIDDVFLPCPDNLVVNLREREELVRVLLDQLPTKFEGSMDTGCALGAALQAAHKLVSPTGGRITVFQTCLPNVGPGSLQPREDPNNRSSKDVQHLNPATDFYKRLALDCSGQQIAVDLFLLNSQYCDLATLSGVSKFSAGEIHHLPLFKATKEQHAAALTHKLRRYLTRKIGFEAVMRVRCTRGLTIHTFHGNFFVRTTDLLSLPNVNPDAGFGMQIAIEENLVDAQTVCLQAALLYTSSKGERRIRVHTLCLPVANNLSDILHSADQQCIVGLLSSMAVDRSQLSSMSDARDALINVAVDVLSAYKLANPSLSHVGLAAPGNLKLLPLYILALLKCVAFRSGTNTRLDDRLHSMLQLKTLPLYQLIQSIYPDLYQLKGLENCPTVQIEDRICPNLGRLHLSAEKLDSRSIYLLDANDRIFIYIGRNCPNALVDRLVGVGIGEDVCELPEIETQESELLRNFVWMLQDEKPCTATIQVIRDESQLRSLLFERLIEDRHESALSYHEFLQYLKTQVKP